MPVGDLANFEINLEKWKLTSTGNETFSYNSTPRFLNDNPTFVEDAPTLDKDIPSFIKEPIVSVMKMLSETQNGRLILSYYAQHNILHEEQRTLLISTLAKYIESKGYQCSLSDCMEMEKQICKIFPTETIVSKLINLF